MISKNFLKFSKRRRAVPLRPIWPIMVATKLDHSRVLATKFHRNRLTLKGRSAGQSDTATQTDSQTDSQTNSAENNGPSGLQSGQQAGGFYGPIAPPIPNAPSSECPQASVAVSRRTDGSIRISRRPSCCFSSAIAGIAIGANFKKSISSVSLVRIESNFFYNTQETVAKNDGPEF